MKIALAGNPNCGKTTLFNSLTGATAHVGNWPGVTVDKKEGWYKKLPEHIQIVDLPGIYSLSPYTPEEIVSRNFIINETPDCVINVIDATNLERNLYLTTQILEIDVPVVIALNMMDVVRKHGGTIDVQTIEQTLQVPVVEISALKNEGIAQLMKVAYQEAKQPRKGTSLFTDTTLTTYIQCVQAKMEQQNITNSLFHAIKWIEKDSIERSNQEVVIKDTEQWEKKIDTSAFDGDMEGMIADARYQYIAQFFTKMSQNKKIFIPLSVN